MKKWFVCGFLVLALSLAMSTAALAADGIQGANSTVGNTVTLAADQNNPDKLNVTYADATANSEYVVFATSGGASELPTESNLIYIDQKTAPSGGVTFGVYPKALTNGTYQVWMSSNAASGIGSQRAENIGNFTYATTKPAYTLGDVDENGNITANDAVLVLEMYVGTRVSTDQAKLAGDADGNGKITANDAVYILEAYVGLRTL